MGSLVRCLSNDGTVVVLALDSTDITAEAQRIHGASKVCTAALGRLLTGASMMGYMLKNAQDSVTVRVSGGGPGGAVIAAADSAGNVRGYMMDPHVELPLNPQGKLDVGGLVGRDGFLSVAKDLGGKEPTVGQVELVSGEIAEDLTSYFALSEQIPTACALGVLVNPDLTVACAGGYLIQLLPTADDGVIERVEEGLRGLPPVTRMLSQNMTPEAICRAVLPRFELGVLDTAAPAYRCTCSRAGVERALLAAGREALAEMAEDPETQASCHFCNTVYTFTPQEIRALLARA